MLPQGHRHMHGNLKHSVRASESQWMGDRVVLGGCAGVEGGWRGHGEGTGTGQCYTLRLGHMPMHGKHSVIEINILADTNIHTNLL